MTLIGCRRFTVISSHRGVGNNQNISSEPDSSQRVDHEGSESRISETSNRVAPPCMLHCDSRRHLSISVVAADVYVILSVSINCVIRSKAPYTWQMYRFINYMYHNMIINFMTSIHQLLNVIDVNKT